MNYLENKDLQIDNYQKVRGWISKGPKNLFLNGVWKKSDSGDFFDTFDPATDEFLASLSTASKIDVDQAIQSARNAFNSKSWSCISTHERSNYLRRIAELVEIHQDELAIIESLDVGMPISHSKLVVKKVIEILYYFSGWPTKIFGKTFNAGENNFLYTLREPIGVCGLIVPWNMPLLISANKLANALACGNTVVLKPAELASLSSLRLVELIEEAGLPPGVVNLITGFGTDAGSALASHPDVDKISFTGSSAVGAEILGKSSINFKKITLELGGKSPNIIFPDADIEKAIAAAVKSFCTNAGQVCSAGTRLFIHKEIYEDCIKKIKTELEKYTLGGQFDNDTKIGPLISKKQMDSVLSYINEEISNGSSLIAGGKRHGNVGNFVEPTVFANVINNSKIAQNEIFGPVLCVINFEDEQSLISEANDIKYGLAAAVWTKDLNKAHRLANSLHAGRIWINTYGDFDPSVPAGGHKHSGLGTEFGEESINEFTKLKTVFVNL